MLQHRDLLALELKVSFSPTARTKSHLNILKVLKQPEAGFERQLLQGLLLGSCRLFKLLRIFLGAVASFAPPFQEKVISHTEQDWRLWHSERIQILKCTRSLSTQAVLAGLLAASHFSQASCKLCLLVLGLSFCL